MYRTPGMISEEGEKIRTRLTRTYEARMERLQEVRRTLHRDCTEQRAMISAEIKWHVEALVRLNTPTTPDPHYMVEYADNRETLAA